MISVETLHCAQQVTRVDAELRQVGAALAAACVRPEHFARIFPVRFADG